MNGLVVRCQDHPTYRGVREPRVDCATCRWIRSRNGMSIPVGNTVRERAIIGGPKP